MIQRSTDELADAAYLSLSTAAVARTIPVGDAIAVDLDVEGRVVGIEILGLSAKPMPSRDELDQLDSLGVSASGREALLVLLSGAA